MAAPLFSALDLTKRYMRWVSLKTVAAAWTAFTILLLLLFVLWDHARDGGVPAWAGTSMRVVFLAATSVWLALAVVVPWLRQISDMYAARLIERQHPEFRNTVVGAVQLAGREELAGSIRVAIVSQASHQVRATNLRRAVPSARLRLWTMTLLAALVSFAAYSVAAPKSVLVSIRRAFGAHLAPPTYTLIESVEPAAGLRVLRGQEVPFRVTLRGRRPGTAAVRFSSDGGLTWSKNQELALRESGQRGAWWGTRSGADVQASSRWQIVAGDARSEIRELIVLPEPDIIEINVRYEYPRYTGLPPTTQPGGDLDAIVGTSAHIEARANVPVRQPVLIIGEDASEQRRVPSQAAGSAASRTLSAQILVLQEDVYRLAFRDEDGHPNAPIRYKIHARADLPPTVDWEDPAGGLEVLAWDPISIQARAEDDFGIARAVLAWRKSGAQVVRELPVTVRMVTAGQYSVLGMVTASQLGLAAGESAEIWVSVWDNREDSQGGPASQRADSPMRSLSVRRPPATAPAIARKSNAGHKPDDTQPAEGSMSKRDEDESDQTGRAAEPKPKQERTLQEFVNEHEKELALLEAKLARETQNEPGGREQTSVPDLVPDKESAGTKQTAKQPAADRQSNASAENGGSDQTPGADAARQQDSEHREKSSASAESDALAPDKQPSDKPGESGQQAGADADGPANAASGDKPSGERQRASSTDDRGPQNGKASSDRKSDSADKSQAGEHSTTATHPAGASAGQKASKPPLADQAGGGEQQQQESEPASRPSGRTQETNQSSGENATANGQQGKASAQARQQESTQPSQSARQQTPASMPAGEKSTDAPSAGQRQSDNQTKPQASQQPSAGASQSKGEPHQPAGDSSQSKADPSETEPQQPQAGQQGQQAAKGQQKLQGEPKPEGEQKPQGEQGQPGEQGEPGQQQKQGSGEKATANGQQAKASVQTRQEQSTQPSQSARQQTPASMPAGEKSTDAPSAGQRQSDNQTKPQASQQPSAGASQSKGEPHQPAGDSSQSKADPSETEPQQPQAGQQGQQAAQGQQKLQGEQKPQGEQGQPGEQGGSGQQGKQDTDPSATSNQKPSPSQSEPQGSQSGGKDGQKGPKGSENSGANGAQQSAKGDSQQQSGTDSQGPAQGAGPSASGSKGEGQPSDQASSAGENGSGSQKGQGGQGKSGESSGQKAGESQGSPSTDGSGHPGVEGGSPARELGTVSEGSAKMGLGGRQGGISNSLPNSTQPVDDVARPDWATKNGTPSPAPGRLDTLVDTLERELRSGTVDPKLLQELGWDLPRAQQFVKEYRRTKQGGQRQSERTDLPSQQRSTTLPAGDLRVSRGVAPAGSARAFQTGAPTRPDGMEGAADPARQRVPSRYRALFEAYYLSISSQPSH